MFAEVVRFVNEIVLADIAQTGLRFYEIFFPLFHHTKLVRLFATLHQNHQRMRIDSINVCV